MNNHTRGIRAALVLGAAVLSGAAAFSAPAPKHLEFPTGRITYKFTSKSRNGTSVLTWIENGKRFRQDISTTLPRGDRPVQINSWMIGDEKNVYLYQPTLGKTLLRTDSSDASEFGGSPLKPKALTEGKLVGRETFLGRKCEIRELNKQRFWVWKGIPVKFETGAGSPVGNMSVAATKIETNVKLSPERFKKPQGYEVREMKDFKNMMGGASGMSPRSAAPSKGPSLR